MNAEEYEYFIQQLNPNCWKIYKVSGHYKEPSATYTVMLHLKIYQCDCPASPKHCKHIDMVEMSKLSIMQPKKDLF
jgi:hypothetical protein